MKFINTDKTKLFVYVSILFLLAALYKSEFLYLPEVKKPFLLFCSIICLVLAFVVEAIPWRMILNHYGFKVSNSESFISIGISVFGKYIPGKVWAIIGRSGYLSDRYSYSPKNLAAIALKAQLLVIWTGLVIGSTVFLFIDLDITFILAAIGLLVLLSILIFTGLMGKLLNKILLIFKKHAIEFPEVNLHDLLGIISWYFLQWLFWCLGFYLLVAALFESPAPLYIGLFFSLAATLGILSFISPGGLGVREAVLVFSLVSVGLTDTESLSISVVARIWFLLGEIISFIVAFMLLNYLSRKNKKH